CSARRTAVSPPQKPSDTASSSSRACTKAPEFARCGGGDVFIGHFAVAFAAKKVAPKASLGTLVFAAVFLDAVWPVLVLLGIERFRIVAGYTAINPFEFLHYPWSHSMLMTGVWAVLFAIVYQTVKADRAASRAVRSGAVVTAAAEREHGGDHGTDRARHLCSLGLLDRPPPRGQRTASLQNLATALIPTMALRRGAGS